MHRPGFAMKLALMMTALTAGARFAGDSDLSVGVRKRSHGPSPAYEGYRAFSTGPRIAFTARSGRTIVRETVAGSDHERRLLRRRDARRV